MTRSEFFKSLLPSVVAVKALGETMPDGSPPAKKRLLAIEFDRYLTQSNLDEARRYLGPVGDRYGIEFLVLPPDCRLVDPHGPTQAGPTFAEVRSIADEEAIKHRELLLKDICHLFAVPPDQIV